MALHLSSINLSLMNQQYFMFHLLIEQLKMMFLSNSQFS